MKGANRFRETLLSLVCHPYGSQITGGSVASLRDFISMRLKAEGVNAEIRGAFTSLPEHN